VKPTSDFTNDPRCRLGVKATCKRCIQEQRAATAEKNAAIRLLNPVTEKACSQCKETLHLDFFYRNKNNSSGLDSACIMCNFIPVTKRNAERRNKERNEKGRAMDFTITVASLRALPTTCAITGVKLVFCSGMVHMASLDRIVDALGYTDKNVRFVDIRVSTWAKWTIEKWIFFCGPDWQANLEAHAATIPPETEKMDGFTLRAKLNDIAKGANKRNQAMIAKGQKPPKELRTYTTEDMVTLWKRQGGRCAYSNLALTWGKITESNWTVSIERIKGGWYIDGNIALIVAECNSAEYRTDRFKKTNTEPVGWSAAVVRGYRANFMVASS
jgi:hypothetical protein